MKGVGIFRAKCHAEGPFRRFVAVTTSGCDQNEGLDGYQKHDGIKKRLGKPDQRRVCSLVLRLSTCCLLEQ